MYIKSLSLSFYLLFHSWVRARRVEDEVVLKRTRRTETLSGVGVGVRVKVFSRIFQTSSLSLFLSLLVGLRAWKMMRIFRTPRTSVFVSVSQTLEVTIFGSIRTSLFVPRTPFFVRVFQTLEMTIPGSTPTCIFIPRTPVFVRVF